MMSGTVGAWAAPLLAAALAALAAAGCGREPSVASKSAAEFRAAQKRGETFAGDGHAHGHGAETPGDEHAPAADAAPGEEAAHPGHAPGAKAEPAADGDMRHQEGHGEHARMAPGRRPAAPGEHGGHAAAEPGRRPPAPAGQAGHAGHGAMAPKTQPAAPAPPAAGHAGHAPSPAGAQPAPSAPEPAAVSPGQPAATLRPDPLDAPAATSQIDARRSAEMAREMAGGHGAHGAGTYRQVDAGRGPEAHEPQPPKEPAKPPEHQHEPPDTGGSAPASRRQA